MFIQWGSAPSPLVSYAYWPGGPMLRIADFVGVYPAAISTFAYGELRLSGNESRFRFLREAAEPLCSLLFLYQ